jgi:GxxExxY protein
MINRREHKGHRDVGNLNELTDAIIDASMEVHRTLGPGLLESTYEMCLCPELVIRGIPIQLQVPIPVEYKGVKNGLRRRMLGLVEEVTI